VVGGLGLVIALAAAAPAASKPARPSPAVTNLMARLTGVGASSPSDALAVGSSIDSHGTQRAVALHWNGTQWTSVTVPTATGSELDGVTTPSASDAWTVGLGPGRAAAGDDVWAVGGFVANHQNGTLMLHWDGHAWTRVPVPSQAKSSGLGSVTALSDTDAWAVGQGPSGTLVLHWNGTDWTQVASPSPTGAGNFLTGVSADSAADAWTVGEYDTGTKNPKPHTLLLHWNGTDWTRF
jgi:hypothetical protein